jgi:hypothetical protein
MKVLDKLVQTPPSDILLYTTMFGAFAAIAGIVLFPQAKAVNKVVPAGKLSGVTRGALIGGLVGLPAAYYVTKAGMPMSKAFGGVSKDHINAQSIDGTNYVIMHPSSNFGGIRV